MFHVTKPFKQVQFNSLTRMIAHLLKQKSLWSILLFIIVLIVSPGTISKVSATITFPNGVASGDVTSNSAVLWTRTNQDAMINLEVSSHPNFVPPEFKSSVHAALVNDSTAKSTVTGLRANTLYYYRFSAGGTYSDVGWFKTAPLEVQAADVHFAWSGDTDPSIVPGQVNRYFGGWTALVSAITERPDFFVYLGDVIYSDLRANNGKSAQVDDVKTLDGFRQIYKQARDVAALHELLRQTSIYPVWDDHEVRSDWAGQTVDRTIYTFGKKAFNEYMPIREPWVPSDPNCAGPVQFRVKHWGSGIDLIILDTRSCRSANAQSACLVPSLSDPTKMVPDPAPTLPPPLRDSLKTPDGKPLLSKLPDGCLSAIKDPNRTMLGPTQKAMFKSALMNSKAKFKFVISSVNIQQTYAFPYDNWEGYSAERSEILKFIRDNSIKNVIFMSTDSHLNLMNQVSLDKVTDSKKIAYEVVTGPIAALTDEKNLLAQSPIYLAAKKDILSNKLVVDCFNLNKFSYGSVIFTKGTNLLKITLKDENGNTIQDEVRPNTQCTKTFVPEG